MDRPQFTLTRYCGGKKKEDKMRRLFSRFCYSMVMTLAVVVLSLGCEGRQPGTSPQDRTEARPVSSQWKERELLPGQCRVWSDLRPSLSGSLQAMDMHIMESPNSGQIALVHKMSEHRYAQGIPAFLKYLNYVEIYRDVAWAGYDVLAQFYKEENLLLVKRYRGEVAPDMKMPNIESGGWDFYLTGPEKEQFLIPKVLGFMGYSVDTPLNTVVTEDSIEDEEIRQSLSQAVSAWTIYMLRAQGPAEFAERAIVLLSPYRYPVAVIEQDTCWIVDMKSNEVLSCRYNGGNVTRSASTTSRDADRKKGAE